MGAGFRELGPTGGLCAVDLWALVQAGDVVDPVFAGQLVGVVPREEVVGPGGAGEAQQIPTNFTGIAVVVDDGEDVILPRQRDRQTFGCLGLTSGEFGRGLDLNPVAYNAFPPDVLGELIGRSHQR